MFNNGNILGPSLLGFKSSEASGNFMIATGGTVSTYGNIKVHILDSSQDFTILKLGSGLVKRLLIGAGGGGGLGAFGSFGGSAGGAGEYNYQAAYLFTSIGAYPFVCGVPGNGATTNGTDGTAATNSSFDGVTVLGGGKGLGGFGVPGGPSPYGIGGAPAGVGAIGSTGTVLPFTGGTASVGQAGAGGSGGANGSAANCLPAQSIGSAPGAGMFNNITGTNLEYCAGGWGGGNGTGQHVPAPPANYGNGGDGSCTVQGGNAITGAGSVLIIAYQYK